MSADELGVPDEKDDLVVVARAVKVRGLRGEVVAELLTDFPNRFAETKRFFAIDSEGRTRTFALEDFWFHQKRVVLKFKGYDSPEAANELVGLNFAITEAECASLEKDEFFEWQLIGCSVETIEGARLGTIREVMHTGSAPILVIADEEREHEHLVPLAASICVEIDTAQKKIRVDAPEGLLEL
jgi:16S rRNA processing protein RimM